MRRRERDRPTESATRRRMELLEAELARLRVDGDRPPVAAAETNEEAFFEHPEPLAAGPPGALVGGHEVLYAPVGRALPPEPEPVPAPGRHDGGRHAVPRRSFQGEQPGRPGLPEWVEDRVPTSWRGRVALDGQHVTLLAVVAVVVLAVTGWLTLRGGGSTSVPQARFVAGRSTASPPSSAAPVSPSASAASGTVVVDVAGKVVHPGVVTLPSGSRVQDAVTRAGGVRPGASAGTLNLARPLVDGEQVLVGIAPAAGAAPAAVAATAAPTGGMVNLNSASESELEDLPGVGPVTAQKILQYRTAHGAFSSVDQLLEVDGIGDKTLADIAPHATL